MSEYWVSRKKYFCKYCDIYIADDVPSRTQHENGLRHKGNKERFVRSLYKAGEKRKRDEDEEKREMARIDRAAQAAFAEDVAAGRAKASSSTLPGSPSSSQAGSSSSQRTAVKPSNLYANYSTPESLGYSDPDAARQAAEFTRKQREGVVGEWEVVTPVESAAAPVATQAESDAAEETKRDTVPEGTRPPDGEDIRGFKLRKRTAGLGDLYDPGIITVKKEQKGDVAGKEEENAVKRGEDGTEVKQENSASLFRKRKRKM